MVKVFSKRLEIDPALLILFWNLMQVIQLAAAEQRGRVSSAPAVPVVVPIQREESAPLARIFDRPRVNGRVAPIAHFATRR